MSTSIPISGLNIETQVQSQDFVPIVYSASLTTYRTTVQSLGNWINASGSSSSSLSSISSSYSLNSSYSISSSWSSASFSAVSASWSSASFSAVSASWSSASLSSSYLNGVATASLFGTSSWANSSKTAISSSWSSASFSAVSASWSSASLSSSYAITASYAATASFLQGSSKSSVITFISPSRLISTSTYTNPYSSTNTYYQYDISSSYFSPTSPLNVNGIILQVSAPNPIYGAYFYISNNSSGDIPPRIIMTVDSQNFSANVGPRNGFGFFPVSASSTKVTFWYSPCADLYNLDLLGYF